MAKKKKGLLQTFKGYIFIPAFIVAVILISTIILVTLYAYLHSQIFIIIFDVVTVVTLVLYIIFYIRLSRKLTKTYYKQLYETTLTNLNKIKNNDTNLVDYGKSDIREIQLLNKATGDIKAKLDSAFLVVKKSDYSSINLEYINKDLNLITYKSFKDNIANIIFVSQSYRNVIIEVYFDFPGEVVIQDKDKDRLLSLYRDTFKEHDNVLYMFGEENRSLIIYIPVIDSFSEIKEKLNFVVTNSSLMVRDERGIRNILAKYALVCYPFSNEDMILGDLQYAKSLGKPYNLYLPIRYKSNVGSNLLLNTSMSMNYTSKIVEALSNLDYSTSNNNKNETILKNSFEAIANFLDVDDAGIITYNDSMDRYYSYVSSRRSSLFTNHDIKKEVVEAFASVIDQEDAYYFSTRNHANISLQPILGLYGIQSGIYYVVKDLNSDKVFAIIYLFNRNKDLHLNTYLRETFFIFSLRIENHFEKGQISDYADIKETENENILALANMFVYHVDDDYTITYLSKNSKKGFPLIKKGEKCYKALFGLDKSCKDCPFVSKKKKYITLGNTEYEVSTTLSDRKDDDRVLLVKQVTNNDQVGDLYQEDFLTYSYKTLVTTIKNEYSANARGYVLLLAIDNYEEILKKIGSEGYNFLIRDYVRSLKNTLGIEDIYYYNASTLAIHFPFIGHKDIITKIENIYPLSKQNYYDNKEFCKLSITYLPVGYPRGYAYAEDYLKHISDFYREKHERNRDYIYFADFPIERSASKREFMIGTLEKEFSGHNSTSMNLQPIVRVKDGHIYGAEILLRIEDAHRNVFFNAQEISHIAEQEKKTGMITESIINFIGTMYKEYGNNIFKINKFNRIAINIDQTYLDDKSLLTKLISLCEENKLPNGFVSLEIPEELIPENKENIRALASQLEKYHILFSCDRYLGQYIDIEELAYLGFKEVKIARDIILAIDKDQGKYRTLFEIVNACKTHNVGVSAVGVENEAQFKILKELDEDMMVQGYYLYKPLTRADLITALISYEN